MDEKYDSMNALRMDIDYLRSRISALVDSNAKLVKRVSDLEEGKADKPRTTLRDIWPSDFEGWVEKGRATTFYGLPVWEFRKDELLALVGYVMEKTYKRGIFL